MKKKLMAMLLAVVMTVGLLPGTALAADNSAQDESVKIALSERYLYAGANSSWYTDVSYWAAPWVGDLDGDGSLEVLNAASYLSVMDAATGALKWRVAAGRDLSNSDLGNRNEGAIFCDFKVLDIDDDEKNEIVIGYSDGSISVLDDQGHFKKGWPVQIEPFEPDESCGIFSLVVDDLNLDGKMEIIVGVGYEHPESVFVYHCDGTLAEGWPQLEGDKNGTHHTGADKDEYRSKTAYSAGVYANGIVTGDLNGDGYPEIIVPTDSQYIDAYYYNGSLVRASDIYSDEFGPRMWGKIPLYEDYNEDILHKNEGWGYDYELDTRESTYRAQMTNAGTVYTDLDGDGKAEIVIATYIEDRTTFDTKGNNTATLADTRYMTVFVLNQDRSRYVNEKKGFDWTVVPNELNSEVGLHRKAEDVNDKCAGVHPVPVAEDLDGDGFKEIIFNSYDGMVHCFSLDWKPDADYADLSNTWSFLLPKNSDTVYEYATPVVCKDINNDGELEVIFASWTDCDDENVRTKGNTYGDYGGTGVNGALYVLSSKGELLASMDLHNGYRAYEDRLNPDAGYTNGVKAAPLLADIDGDGADEILLNTRYYGLCAYEITVGGSAPVAPDSFVDVNEDGDNKHWFAGAVRWAVDNGIAVGTGEDKFSPNSTCNHAEIITFLWRANGKPTPSTTQVPFEMKSSEWYALPVYWAAGLGMVGDSFEPYAPCSRADVAVYIWKAFSKPGSGEYLPRFNDVTPELLGGWSSEQWLAINWVACNGITVGLGNNQFGVNSTCTRAEIVTFLQRAYLPEHRL